jgi:hypothetical protein
MAIDTSLVPFFTRPGALFFLIIALFSAAFPWFQIARGKKLWPLFYMPFACFAVCLPLTMMAWQHNSIPRGVIAVVVLASGAYILWKRWKSGWDLNVYSGRELSEG